MNQGSMSLRDAADRTVRDIRRKTRKQYSAEEKIRIVLSGLRGEDSIAELCRREGIAESLYYRWSKEFLEAGKKRLSGDTARQASSGEVKELRHEMRDLKEALAVEQQHPGEGAERVADLAAGLPQAVDFAERQGAVAFDGACRRHPADHGVGLEDVDDIKDDLDRALAKAEV